MKAEGRIAPCETRSGLTLLELLALIALLVVLALIFVPAITSLPPRHTHTRQLANGRAIFQMIFAASTDSLFPGTMPSDKDGFFPGPDAEWQGESSTAYFRYLMDSEVGVLSEDFSLFSGPGVPYATSLEEFGPENNMWSVVAGGQGQPTNTPFLLSRNVNESELKDWKPDQEARLERVGSKGGKGAYTTPWDRSWVVVIRRDGSGMMLRREHHKWSNLNPGSVTHPVLQP